MTFKTPAFLLKIERNKINFFSFIFSLLGLIFLRVFLELFSSPSFKNGIFDKYTLFFHYPLFYLPLFILLIILLRIFSRESLERITKTALFFFPVIILPPLLDLLFSGGQGFRIAYLFTDVKGLVFDFFTFFGPWVVPGITPGIRYEVLLLLSAIFLYLLVKRKKILLALVGTFLGYFIIFIFLAWPSIIFSLVFKKSHYLLPEIISYFRQPLSFLSEKDLGPLFSFKMALFYYLWLVISLLGYFYFWHKEKFKYYLADLRYSRLIHYILLFFLGLGLAHYLKIDSVFPLDFFNLLSLVYVVVLIIISWAGQVGLNDLYDIEIDRISHPERPLVKGKISKEELKKINFLIGVLILWGGLILPPVLFFFLMLFNLLYYLYSVPPFRLKRFPFIASFSLALACLSILLLGFYFNTSPDNLIPSKFAYFIFLIYFLGVNIKDLNDVKGDLKGGIKTLPVLLGQKKSQWLLALLVAFAFLLPSFYFNFAFIKLIAFLFALVSFCLLIRFPFSERYFFILYFLYLLYFIFNFFSLRL
jgi:4-hydroxybenzoate polyprenyltransferase